MEKIITQNQPDENKQIIETPVVPEPEYLPASEYINRIVHGNCLDVLKRIPENTVDLVVTDPPYGINLMGMGWDKTVPNIAVWRECHRTLKPGAFAFVMSSARQDTFCEMVTNLSQAGFQTNFSSMYWTYVKGVPKGQNIAKTIAKQMGSASAKGFEDAYGGFQPKPAVEIIIVAMKPCAENSFYRQALENNKGMTHLGKCMIPYSAEEAHRYKNDGRFPANLLVSDNALKDYSRYFSLDQWARMNLGDLLERDLETFPHFIIPKASTREKEAGLDDLEWKKITMGGKESFAAQRPTSKQRKNNHPTVKPLKLAAYLVKLGSTENDKVLDLFAGSGTTCMAAAALNRRYIGMEISSEYCEIARRRIEHIQREMASGGNETIESIRPKATLSSSAKDSAIEFAREKVISHPMPEFFSRRVEKPKTGLDVFKNALKPSLNLPSAKNAAVDAKESSSSPLSGLFASDNQSKGTGNAPKGSSSPPLSLGLPPMNAAGSGGKRASSHSRGSLFGPKNQLHEMIKGDEVGISEDFGSARRRPRIPSWML